MPICIAALYRYPVKGLSAERLAHVKLLPGECLPQDRRFAIALAATRFDPALPEWLPKTNFAMLMRDEILAELQTRFDAESGVLTIQRARGERFSRRRSQTPPAATAPPASSAISWAGACRDRRGWSKHPAIPSRMPDGSPTRPPTNTSRW